MTDLHDPVPRTARQRSERDQQRWRETCRAARVTVARHCQRTNRSADDLRELLDVLGLLGDGGITAPSTLGRAEP